MIPKQSLKPGNRKAGGSPLVSRPFGTLVSVLLLFLSVMAENSVASPWNWRETFPTRGKGTVRHESLYYESIPVVAVRRKFYRGVPLDPPMPLDDRASIDLSVFNTISRQATLLELQSRWEKEAPRSFRSAIRWTLTPTILYFRKNGSARPAWEARAFATDRYFLHAQYFDPVNNELIATRPLFRTIANKVYLSSPYNGGTNTAGLDAVTLPFTGAATTLSSAYLTVKREQPDASTGFEKVEVDPNTQFWADGSFSTDPDSVNTTCRGATNACPNQGFDAVNVYHHLENYRERVETLLTSIGETVDWPADPLPVFVNAKSFDLTQDGDTDDEVNNAAFTTACVGVNASGKCVIVNPPARASYGGCGGSKKFYDLAREAIVLVHEYQHYITDTIAGLQTDVNGTNVGDILHEGYSDYFGVSQVSRIASTEITKVLEYGFQNCPVYQRAIGTPKIFDATSTRTDPHYYGWTWASGLYELHQSLGAETVDKIALKSLFYLPTQPSYIDAVEALVRADSDLFAGANAGTIRALFYDDLHFVGGLDGVFADSQHGIAAMGVSSCLSVSPNALAGAVAVRSGFLNLAVFLLWILSVVGMGRWYGSKSSL